MATSEPLLDEPCDKLAGKFGVTAADVSLIRARLESAAFMVYPDFKLHAVPDDPDDNRVLECAVAGQAGSIISGDRHLMRLGAHAGIPIVTVREFLAGAGFLQT